MSVELTIETVEETIVLELQDHVPAVLTIDHIPDLRDELDSKVDKEPGLGLSELSFTTADKSSLDQSEQDRHTHSNKTVIDDLSDAGGVLQYKGLPISDQAALDAKVDKVAGKSLVDDTEIAKLLTVAQDATKNATDAELRDRATHTGEQVISTVTGLQGALDSKVDKESGKSLISDLEIAKLSTVQENATANRDDSLNADKVHGHVISDIDTLAAKLELINQWLQVPADKKYFDFIGDRYSADGVPATVSSLSQFTRLSSATQWKDGVLVDVAANVMRLDKAKGLLIEPQITNFILHSRDMTNPYWSVVNVTQTGNTIRENTADGVHAIRSAVRAVPQYDHTRTQDFIINPLNSRYIGCNYLYGIGAQGFVIDVNDLTYINSVGSNHSNLRNVSIKKQDGLLFVSYTIDDIGGWDTLNSSVVSVQFYREKSVSAGSRAFLGDGTTELEIIYIGSQEGVLSSSPIPTTTAPVTRAKETLVVPFTTGQTVTADKDEGVTMTIVDNNAVFEGHGYIRSVRVN